MRQDRVPPAVNLRRPDGRQAHGLGGNPDFTSDDVEPGMPANVAPNVFQSDARCRVGLVQLAAHSRRSKLPTFVHEKMQKRPQNPPSCNALHPSNPHYPPPYQTLSNPPAGAHSPVRRASTLARRRRIVLSYSHRRSCKMHHRCHAV